ncbi:MULTISPECIES: carbohydrate ABC transporter permease [unclassified Curtobacterium]|uniref:carbohydrate ABC transporter permease n=1 Tax=unclassified Curtobacterium TaxID=257496 RepID=UPI0008DD6E12|nr:MULTISPECIES: sugar ABC transporter permease [unclassified Curtobacterium]OII21881.1 sugar ABC transporter permease [Curtobacterium sp. MCBA15_016]OII24616.1 sugar ABC transporter permease [Curtobacterium sp. MCBA15_013]SFF53961.1 multiple sugar transport system permease protein [Curtobacterium sp. YR515]
MTIHTERHPTSDAPARTQRASGPGAPGSRRPTAGTTRPPAHRTDGFWPWLFVLPLLVGVGTFYIWPIIQTFWYSFTTWGVFGGATFSGIANYVRLVSDPQLYQSLLNTVIYTVIVLLGIPVAVWLASLLNTPGLRFAQFYRVLFFLPYVAMPAAIALVWRIMFNGDYGIVNWFIGLFGIDGPYWISTPGFALVAVSLVGLWSSLGFSMIILGAGLKDIPPELYEAAELDGASRWRQFRSVTVPLLSPSIFFVVIVTTISSFQLFDLLYAILGSTNPVIPKTMSLVFYFYSAGFIDNDKGFAAAIAMVIFVLIGIVTLVQFRFQRKWVQA